jgi:Cellulose binding domain
MLRHIVVKRQRAAMIVLILLLLATSLMTVLPLRAKPKTNKIVEENQKPGTTNWKSADLERAHQESIREKDENKHGASYSDSGGNAAATAWADTHAIKGYAGKTSVNHGQSISFYISTTQPSYTIEIYRMGWYSGTGGRLIITAQNLTGHNYGVPAPDPTTGMVAATWPVAYTLQTAPDWVTGVYQAKLIASDGSAGYIIFVVRDDAGTADIVFQMAITTYQAYNNWGGKSLYEFNSTGGRASKVSYDRPYELHAGAGPFYDGDYNMIRWLEAQGYDITYVTSIDLESNANLMANHQVFLSNWHDEYWSKTMRDHVTAFRDQGKHLAFFDSNNIYWQIRFESSSSGVPYRVQVGYKDATKDPMANSSTPWLTTVRWRDAPVNQPENALLGVMYEDDYSYSISYPYVVASAGHWIYEGTGLSNGSSIQKVIGHEYDKVFDNGLTPANLIVLSNSPIPIYNSISNASIYTAPSGALVFDVSTNRWSWLLDDNEFETTPKNPIVEKITANLLNHMIGNQPSSPTPVPSATRTPTTIRPTNTPGGTGGSVKVQYRSDDASAFDNQIKARINIVNLTGGAIPLSSLKFRYYFTRDTAQPLAFTCLAAYVVGCANLTRNFVALPAPLPTADYYLEIGFTSGAGNLAPNGQTGDIFVRINKADWSTFNETNDYSYDGTKTNLTDWNKITLYQNGVLVWGVEPANPTLTATRTASHTPTATNSPVPSNTPTETETPTPSPTLDITATAPTESATPGDTPTSPTETGTPTPDVTAATPTPTPSPTNTSTAGGTLRLQYMTTDTLPSDTQIKTQFQIVNTSSSSIPLSELKIRYYFTRDTAQSMTMNCDYFQFGCGTLIRSFVALNPRQPNADYYLELGFTTGSIAANSRTNSIRVRFNKVDWSQFNQTNDYSFDPSKTSFADWDKVTLYRNGTLVWGVEPGSSAAPTFVP